MTRYLITSIPEGQIRPKIQIFDGLVLIDMIPNDDLGSYDRNGSNLVALLNMSDNRTSSCLILMLRRGFFFSKSNNKNNTKMRQQRYCPSRRTKLSPVYLILICCVVTCLMFITSNFFLFINDEQKSSIIESINPQSFKNNVPTRKTLPTTKFHTIHLPSPPPLKNNNNFANVTITSRIYRPLKENAIVFMVQKTHSTYENRDSYGMLLHSLDLLYQNYLSLNNVQTSNATTTSSGHDNTDIYLFHTGDYHPSDLDIIEPHVMPPTEQQDQGHHKGIIKLVNLKDTKYWNLPANLRNDNPTEDWIDYSLFPIGYRHMCRFFAIKIWDLFQTINKQQQQETNYQYIWRLDEDSLILSPIKYNVFDYMNTHQYKYGYRMCSYELSQHKFGTHTWFVKKHKAIQPKRTIDYNLCGFYNNFFIANLQFMLSKKVQSLLNEIDKRGFIYRRRYGDLIIHSLIVYAFATPQQIHRFLDFTYQHVTIDKRVNKDGCLLWGGIQAGYLDPHPTKSMLNFQKQHNLLVIGNNGSNNNSTQNYCVANKTKLSYEDLSPTYSHLSDEMKKSISLQTITAGKVELVGKGILSG